MSDRRSAQIGSSMSIDRLRSAQQHSASTVNEKNNNLATIEEDYNAAQAEADEKVIENQNGVQKASEEVIDDEMEKLNRFEKILEWIWPIRGKRRSAKETGEGYIKCTLRNLVFYVTFLVVLSIIVYAMVGLINYYFSSGMLSLFIDAPIVDTQGSPSQKTFRGDSFALITMADAWAYLRGPLLDGLHWETWFDLSNTTPDNIGYIFYENKILGRARIVQVRVKNNSCNVPSSMKPFIKKCHASFSSKSEDTQPFGLGLLPSSDSNYSYSSWFSTKYSGNASYSGQVGTYPGNGYEVILGQYREESQAILDELYNNLWMDDKTRAIIIDFTVYNANINLFNQIRLVMEFPSTGGILTSWVVRTAKLLRYVSTMDYGVALCEFIFIFYILYYTIEQFLDARYTGLKAYFTDPFNILDIIIILLSYGTMGLSIYRTIRVNTLLDSLLNGNHLFANFDTLTNIQDIFNQICALIMFLSWLKVFKLIQLNKALEQLQYTCKFCYVELSYFLVSFLLVITAYAIVGYLVFGDLHQDYHEFFKTYFTLFRILVGDFDFAGLQACSPILGPIYFISYIVIGFFVLLSMFMAIIFDSYAQAADEIAKKTPELMFTDFVKSRYAKIADKFAKRNKMMDAEEILDSDEAKASPDGLDFNLWRREMKRKGYADMEIETFFAKYDKDCDRVLNDKEKKALRKDIKKAKSHIEEKFHKNPDQNEDDEETNAADFGEDLEEGNGDKKMMVKDDFEYILGRIDRMELSVASIVNKIDKLFNHLEKMEIDKMKKRQELSNMLAQQEKKFENKDLNLDEVIGPAEFQ